MMRRATFFAVAFVALLVTAPRIVTDVVDTSFYIIDEDTPGDEDAYVLADFGSIESELDGDLTIAVYEDLTISGTVTGDVVVAAGGSVIVTETGSVEGSLRGVARRVVVDGFVGDDVAVVAVTTEVEGEVGRDVVGAGGTFVVGGTIGRNVQGWFLTGTIDAIVGNDVDVRVSALEVGSATDVAGDLLYRADSEASVADGARVAGSLSRLSTSAPFVVRVALALFLIFGLIAFVLLGLLVLWASRRAAPRAAGFVVTRTWRVGLVGLAAVIGAPVVAAAIGLAVQPFLAKLAVVILFLIGAVVAVLFGPIPALAAMGDRLTRGRAGLFGGFVIGVVMWRLVAWAVPLLGLLLSLALLVFGTGAWLTSWWDSRSKRVRAARDTVPPDADGDGAQDWEPPLPPEAAVGAGTADQDSDGVTDPAT